MTWESIVLDAAIVVTIAVSVVFGYRRGFIKSVVRMIGSLLSLVVAFFASGPLAQWIYDSALRASLEATVQETVGESAAAATASLEEAMQGFFEGLPFVLQNGLSAYGMSSGEELSDFAADCGAATASEAATLLMDTVITPIAVLLLQIVLFIVLFLVLSVVVRALGRMMDKVFSSVKVVRRANEVLGGVMGALQGAVIVLVLCAVLQIYMTVAGTSSVITPTHLEQTYVLGWLMEVNPLFHPQAITNLLTI